MTAGIRGLWWFWRGRRKGARPLQHQFCPQQQMRCTPNYSADHQQGQELCHLRKMRRKKRQQPCCHPSTALLLPPSPLPAELPPQFQGFSGGAQPCALSLSRTSRKSIMSNVSRQRRSFSRADAHQRRLRRGNGIWSWLYRSCNGKSLHL